MRPVALITGASAGIGAALAHVFAQHGHMLVLLARREQKLAAVADAIAARGHHRPLVLPLDLDRRDAAGRVGETLARMGVEPSIVVNNAGFGLVGFAHALARSEQLAMIDVNVRALVDLSLAFIASLERHKGGILNVSSVAGFLPGPGMAVYYATKAFVLSFSEALHRELAPKGVRVSVLCPGPVPTEFQARAGDTRSNFPPLVTRTAVQVAIEAYRGFQEGRRLIVPGFPNKVATVLTRVAPRPLLLAAAQRYQRSRRP